jgi:hypothetical protein
MKCFYLFIIAVVVGVNQSSFAQEKETKSFPIYQDIGILGLHTHDLAEFDSFRGGDAIDGTKTLGVSQQKEDGRANLRHFFFHQNFIQIKSFVALIWADI